MLRRERDAVAAARQEPPGDGDLGDVEVAIRQRNEDACHGPNELSLSLPRRAWDGLRRSSTVPLSTALTMLDEWAEGWSASTPRSQPPLCGEPSTVALTR